MADRLFLKVGEGEHSASEDIPEFVLLEESALLETGVNLFKKVVAGVLEEGSDAVMAPSLRVVVTGSLIVDESEEMLVAELPLSLEGFDDPTELVR